MDITGITKILKDDRLKCGYKYITKLAQRIAYNLSNTESQTEVKIISCIPIDVTDLHKKIFCLERELEYATYEKQLAQSAAEKIAKSHASRSLVLQPQIPKTVQQSNDAILSQSKDPKISSSSNQTKASCKCLDVSVARSDDVSITRDRKEKSPRLRSESASRYVKRPFYKSFESFYRDSGMGCQGDPVVSLCKKIRKETAVLRNSVKRYRKRATVIKGCEVPNSDYRHVEPVQFCHFEPTPEITGLEPTSNNCQCRSSTVDKLNTKSQFLNFTVHNDKATHMSFDKIVPASSYLEPIEECCRLESTVAFHDIGSCTDPQNCETNNESISNEISSERQNKTSNLPDSNQLTSISHNEELVSGNCSNNMKPVFSRSSPKNLPKTVSVLPKMSLSKKKSIVESDEIEASPESLGLPNTEPKRQESSKSYHDQAIQESAPVVDISSNTSFRFLLKEAIPKVYQHQATQESAPVVDISSNTSFRFILNDAMPKVYQNQATQKAMIESCSCCFSKRLTNEQLLNLPRSPIWKYLHDNEPTPSSSRTAESCQLHRHKRVKQRKHNIRDHEYASTSQEHGGVVTRYQNRTPIQSTSSHYTVPVCRDEDTEGCSCNAGNFYDIDFLKYNPTSDPYVNTSTSNKQYYDDAFYDLIPVKEKNKKLIKQNLNIDEHARRKVYRNDQIVNYMKQQNKVIDKSIKNLVEKNNFRKTPRKRVRVSSPIKKKKVTGDSYKVDGRKLLKGKRYTISEKVNKFPKKEIKNMECQTQLNDKKVLQSDKHEDALTQLKQTLQSMIDKFKTHSQDESKNKHMQAKQNDNKINYKFVGPKPKIINYMPHITPGFYPAMPILTTPWIPSGGIIMPCEPKHKGIQQIFYQSQCKHFGDCQAVQKTDLIHDKGDFNGDGDAGHQSLKRSNRVNMATNTNQINSFINENGHAAKTPLLSNNKNLNTALQTIVLSNTNLTKTCKNKKISCCLTRKQTVNNFAKRNEFWSENRQENDKNKDKGTANYTGSTVRQVIEELNQMEEYITRSEFNIGDVASSKGSVDKPKKKFAKMLHNIRKVFKSRSKDKGVDKKMSLDNVVMADREFLPSVHLIYPQKTNHRLSRKQNCLESTPFIADRYSYTDLHKKCRDVLKTPKRQTRRLNL